MEVTRLENIHTLLYKKKIVNFQDAIKSFQLKKSSSWGRTSISFKR